MSRAQAFQKRRWICLAAALVICVCAGFGYAWSVLQNPIVAAHGWPEGQVSLAYTVTVVCSTMAPLFFGGLIRRISTRMCIALGAVLFGGGLFLTGAMTQLWQFFLFYGILSGLGCGFIYPSMMAYVVRLFPDRSGLASGLGTAAYGSGAILWAPTSAVLMNTFSLAWAFRILGILFLAVILAASLLLAEPPEGLREALCPSSERTASPEEGGLCRKQMVRTPAFYLIAATFTCGLIAGVIVISQASPILQATLSYRAERAAVFVSVFAACNMAGRFVWGSLSDKVGIRNTMAAVFVLCIASMLLLTVGEQDVLILAAMGLAASCYGGFASVRTPLTAQTFGPKYITENYGVMYVVFGLASLIGPSLATTFKTVGNGSYTGAYLSAAALAAVGLALSRLLKPVSCKGECYGTE